MPPQGAYARVAFVFGYYPAHPLGSPASFAEIAEGCFGHGLPPLLQTCTSQAGVQGGEATWAGRSTLTRCIETLELRTIERGEVVRMELLTPTGDLLGFELTATTLTLNTHTVISPGGPARFRF